ncbi:MAG: hypothetical protein ACKPKO_38520, partial [Candidatus Fonsibacter sp.]
PKSIKRPRQKPLCRRSGTDFIKKVWDESHPRDWDEVRSEARRGGGWGYTVNKGHLFGICVEKHAELDPSMRKFKGLVVFQGNQVSSLATLQAAKAVDFWLPSWTMY